MTSSILPSSNHQTCDLLTGAHGQLQVRELPIGETFALFYLANPCEGRHNLKRGWTMLAVHPNGHSCRQLANRILAAWAGADGARALEQFQHILDCGGLGRTYSTILAVIDGNY